ncbi:MAG TPA: glycosyltransferase family 39 protein, partial [Leptospiraceae bacterium]|nr:glycosyltransferase family 39 protein [Leptospiraceae bacterium]
MVLKNIYFIISLSLIGLLTLLPSAWFIYFDKNFFYFLILSLNFFYIYRVFIKKESFFSVSLSIENRLIILLLLISFLLMVFLPIQNLNLGDGVILLEHVALEAKIFGFHLTMDEILEALIHSVIYAKFQNYFNTPMEVYRIISTIAGFLGILLIYYYFKKFKNSFLSYLLVFTSGGIYLFHGYSENYTLVTLMIWFYILFSIDTIRSNTHRNMKALIPICIIASFLILFHLVSGYLIFSLIYLCYYFSEDKKFIRNAIFSTVFSLVIILPVFIYFIFYANVRFDFSQTHLTNPKFYPISKIISTVHLRDILFCLFGSCLLPFLLIIYALIFDKDRLKKLL